MFGKVRIFIFTFKDFSTFGQIHLLIYILLISIHLPDIAKAQVCFVQLKFRVMSSSDEKIESLQKTVKLGVTLIECRSMFLYTCNAMYL